VRSRTGEQAYMYMKDDGANVRVVLVTIEKEQAAIIRATFSPDKLIEFLNDPKIMGISVNDPPPTVAKPADANKTDSSK